MNQILRASKKRLMELEKRKKGLQSDTLIINLIGRDDSLFFQMHTDIKHIKLNF